MWHIWDILVRIEYDDDDRSGNWQRQLRVTIGCTGGGVTCVSLPTPSHWLPWWRCSLWRSWRARWGWSLWGSWWEFRRLTALVPFDLSSRVDNASVRPEEAIKKSIHWLHFWEASQSYTHVQLTLIALMSKMEMVLSCVDTMEVILSDWRDTAV